MGMCLALHGVSDEKIERILAEPPLIWRLIAPDDPEIYAETVRPGPKRSLWRRLFSREEKPPPSPPPLPNLNLSDAEKLDDDLDKAWQGIHYCLNKTAFEAEPPMDFLTVGGEVVGDVEVGYGPARVIRSGDVERIHRLLSEIDVAALRERYDPAEMDRLDIYPNIWVRDGDDGFDYIAEHFERLKGFVAHCAGHGLGMAVYLC